MKSLLIIILVFLYNCSSSRTDKQANSTYYFYFDVRDQKLEKYYSYKNGPLNYLYQLDTDNVIFTPKMGNKNSTEKRSQISEKDTVMLNIKHLRWLSQFNNLQRDSIFLGKPEKEYFIIEKDSVDNQLYVIGVHFVQEIN